MSSLSVAGPSVPAAPERAYIKPARQHRAAALEAALQKPRLILSSEPTLVTGASKYSDRAACREDGMLMSAACFLADLQTRAHLMFCV